MTVIPLFCARFLKGFHQTKVDMRAVGSTHGSTVGSYGLLDFYERWVRRALRRPVLTIATVDRDLRRKPRAYIRCWASLSSRKPMPASSPSILKVPTGSRIEATDDYVAKRSSN